MSYLNQPTSTTEYGVVKVGDFIKVTDGVISLDQDLSQTASVTFEDVTINGNLFLDGFSVINSVTANAGPGISITDVDNTGPEVTFTVNNTGVLSLVAGTGIAISASTGDITISSSGTNNINTHLVSGPTYTATESDQYIGVNSTSAVTITLPLGTDGRTYTVKDEHGQGSGKITIKGTSGELVDNSATYIISVPFQSVTVVFRGGSWHLI